MLDDKFCTVFVQQQICRTMQKITEHVPTLNKPNTRQVKQQTELGQNQRQLNTTVLAMFTVNSLIPRKPRHNVSRFAAEICSRRQVDEQSRFHHSWRITRLSQLHTNLSVNCCYLYGTCYSAVTSIFGSIVLNESSTEKTKLSVTTLQTMWNYLTFPWRFAALGMLSVTHIMPVLVLLSVLGVGMQQCMIKNHIFNI